VGMGRPFMERRRRGTKPWLCAVKFGAAPLALLCSHSGTHGYEPAALHRGLTFGSRAYSPRFLGLRNVLAFSSSLLHNRPLHALVAAAFEDCCMACAAIVMRMTFSSLAEGLDGSGGRAHACDVASDLEKQMRNKSTPEQLANPLFSCKLLSLCVPFWSS